MTCPRCHGKGEIIACIDDICHAKGRCMHDGNNTCPECKGKGVVVPDECPVCGREAAPYPHWELFLDHIRNCSDGESEGDHDA